MRLTFETTGGKQIDRELLRFSGRVTDASPAFAAIADLIQDETRVQFASEGRHASGGWRPLKPRTLAAKQRKGLRLQILQATGSLMDSLTAKDDPNQIREVTPTSLTFGSRLPYARFHETGTKRMPKRPPLELTEQTRKACVKLMQRFLVEGGV